jgi:N utilization substance protein A
LFQTIDQLSREKGIDAQIIIAAVEDAVLVATRKYYKSAEDLQSRFNKATGQVEVHAVKKVVEVVQDPDHEIGLEQALKIDSLAVVEGEVRIPKATDVLGRIAAQAAKQVIFQKVREAERDTVYAEYNQRVGELVNCTVKRVEGPDIIVDLGRTEARMPRKEQSRGSYSGGDHASGPRRARPAGGGLARRRDAGTEALRDGSPRNLRRHGGDQGYRAGGG